MSFYAQDSWRINKHFTVNFGLRWEPTFSDPDKYKRGDSFSESASSSGSGQHGASDRAPGSVLPRRSAGIPAANWSGQKANFAPRVGMVWNPSGEGKDTLRVGGALALRFDRDLVQRTRNHQPSLRQRYRRRRRAALQSVGELRRWKSISAEPGPFLPAVGHIHRHAAPSQVHLRDRLERHLSAAVRASWMVSASLPGQQDHATFGSRSRTNPDIYIPGNCSAGQYGLTAAGACSSTSGANYQARPHADAARIRLPAIYYASIDRDG